MHISLHLEIGRVTKTKPMLKRRMENKNQRFLNDIDDSCREFMIMIIDIVMIDYNYVEESGMFRLDSRKSYCVILWCIIFGW